MKMFAEKGNLFQKEIVEQLFVFKSEK